MVQYLPLFPYQAQLSCIQTNFPACSSAICGQNFELCSVPAIFQAVSKYFFLATGSLKGFLRGELSSSRGWPADFLGSCQVCVEAGGVYFIKKIAHFFCFANMLILRHTWEISSTQNRCSQTKSFTENFQKKYHNFFYNYAELNHFWEGRTHIPVYKSGEQ